MSNPGINELEQFRDAIEIIIGQLSELFTKLQPTLEEIYECLWRAYRNAGMPYGETDEGLSHWLKEIAVLDCLEDIESANSANEQRRNNQAAEQCIGADTQQHHLIEGDCNCSIGGGVTGSHHKMS